MIFFQICRTNTKRHADSNNLKKTSVYLLVYFLQALKKFITRKKLQSPITYIPKEIQKFSFTYWNQRVFFYRHEKLEKVPKDFEFYQK